MDNLKFSFSPSSSSNESESTNEIKSNVNDPICKICFSKQTRFQISFTETIRLCTNSQCSTFDKSLNDVIKIETNPYHDNKHEQVSKYGYRIPNYAKSELDSLFQNENDLINSIQLYSDLNNVFNNLITSPIISNKSPVVTNAENADLNCNSNSFIPIDQENLFSFESYDFPLDNQQSTFIETTLPNEISHNTLQVRSESVTNQFDENFFTDIDDLLQNGLHDLDQDFTLLPPQTQFTDSQSYNANELDYNNVLTPSNSSTTYTELNPTNPKELSSKLANNFLYSNDFLNPTQVVSSDQIDTIQIEKKESTTNVKSKTVSGIKITRIPKQQTVPPKTSLCLSPSSSPSTSMPNSQTSLDTSSDLLSVQLSPSSQDTDLFKSFETTNKSNKKSKNENQNFLPWEVSSKTSRRSQLPLKRDSLASKQDDSSKSIRPISRVLTKADLSMKTTQKTDFGKEKGAQLKRALLEDTNFLSQTKLLNTSSTSSVGSTKDLVLSVLKKRAVV